MKTKKIKLFARIFSIIMICCFAFLCVGCMGRSPDEYGDDETGTELDFDMYGAKVLYRPNSYDYNAGSGATEEGQINDYYGKYAWEILNALYLTYALGNNNALIDYLPDFDSAHIPYLYDSIRYKVETVGTITSTRADTKAEDGQISKGTPATANSILIVADKAQNWNWSFDYDLSTFNSALNGLLIPATTIEGNKIYRKFNNETMFNTAINAKYTNEDDFTTPYQSIYLGAEKAEDYEDYSDYVKALEYVIYSYALDIEPNEISVTINDNVPAPTVQNPNPSFYTVQVEMYDSVDEALEDIKSLWEKLGSYVGLVQRQINKISDWVLENVVGWGSKITNDKFYRYSSVTEVTTTDHLGNTTISYEFDISSKQERSLERDYENAVDKIVEMTCDEVTIGKDGEQDVYIDNRFLASEVKEYYGNTFMISGDESFPKYEEGQSAVAIQPLEYQSVAIMLKDKINIGDVWVALKYDADLDGTEYGVWDETKYLDIIVELNYFNYAKKKMFTLGSQQTRVYDGPYEFGGEYPAGFPSDHGTLFFDTFFENCKDQEILSILNEDGSLPVGAFNVGIGNNILKTDVGLSGYIGLPLVSKNPLVLVGTTDVRKYYQVVEPADSELGENQTYITGRFNEEMFKGSDGCDYLEITYKVLKTRGDANTNYKFYTGLAAIWDSGN